MSLDESKLIQRLNARWKHLEQDRAPWMKDWKSISEVLLPTAGRYLNTESPENLTRFRSIIDSTSTQALNVLVAGMMSGITNPSMPWFKLEVEDADMEDFDIKQWITDVELRLSSIFQKSNTYRVLNRMYKELAAFGTAVSVIEDDYEDTIRHHPLTVGEYCLAANANGVVDTLYRSFKLSVGQMVKMFGIDKVSNEVKQMFDRGELDKKFDVFHAIEPNDVYDPSSKKGANQAFRSVYWEDTAKTPLRVSGYATFPVLAPRWETVGHEVYGSSPGMLALGDIKHLQTLQKAKTKAIDFITNPALSVPISLKDQFDRHEQAMAGQLIFREANEMHMPIQPLFHVPLDLHHLSLEIGQLQERIRRNFYADIFLMLQDGLQRPQHITAAEVSARQQEKMMMMGPVLDSLQDELLRKLVETTFERAYEKGELDTPPESLKGRTVHVKFVSIMAQAQRAGGITANDRFLANLQQVAGLAPEALDGFNSDAWVADQADRLDVTPSILRSKEAMQQLRQQRAAQQAQQQQMAAMQQQAQTAQTLAKTPLEEQSALSALMQTGGE